MSGGRARPGLVVIAGALLVAGSSLVTALLLRPPPPAELAVAVADVSVPVDVVQYWDERAVTLQVEWGRAVEVRSPRGGMVTEDSCYVGRAVRDGESMLALDGTSVGMADTAVPLWRDLAEGDTGPDVDAVEEWAVRHGGLADASGVMTAATIDALTTALGSVPVEPDGARVLPADSVMWIPSGGPTVADCGVTTGQVIDSGEIVATLTPSLRSVHVLTVDGGVDDDVRDRSLVVDGIEVELPDDGVLSGADLDPVASAPSLRSPSVESGPPVGTTRLRTPITAYLVPPAAITVSVDGTTCVHEDGEPHIVQIVGSELGRTYVTSTVELVSVDTGGSWNAGAASCG